MASFFRRTITLKLHFLPRNLSSASASILTPNSTARTSLYGRKKSREVLSLLKRETNPERIVDICRTFPLSPDSTLDRVTMSVAITKLAHFNCFHGIRLLIDHLKDRPLWRNERFFSHCIILYGQAGMVENAVATFEQMDQLDIHRTVKSLNSLLFACILAKKYDEVKRIFTYFPKRYSIVPDVDTYNHMIEAFCKLGQSSLGYSLLSEMVSQRCKPNETTFGYLIAGFHEEGKFDDVRKVLQLMEEHGMKPGPSTYNFRIEILCKLGRSFEAAAFLDEMLKRGVNPNSTTYRNLIHGFCKEGNHEEAKNLLERMIDHGCQPDPDCYFTLVSFLCQSGDYISALHFSKLCMKKNWLPNFTTMKSLVEGLAKMSKVEEAKELVMLIKEKYPKTAHLWKETEDTLSSNNVITQ